jgi:multiple sugar transport system ATP-binding protein
MATVTFENVVKRFGSFTAVKDVSFDIPEGAFVCLLGPSGCGKTTTLRMIAGLESPTSGTIRIGGRDVTRDAPRQRDVGMVFQDYALYPHMTLSENIAYPLKVRGLDKQSRSGRAAQVAERLQIGHLLERRPSEISGGQQQRSSVARALVHTPQVFLFDEPLSNLDAKLRLEARSFIKHLQKEVGVTAIYVTHDQSEAMALADTIAVMDRGEIVQMGSPLEVYRRPATTFVANFLGSPPMNLLPVRVEADEGLRLVGSGFRLPVPPVLVEHVRPGQSLRLGVRPEHILLGENGDDDAIHGTLYAVEPLGPESLVTILLGGGAAAGRARAAVPPTQAVAAQPPTGGTLVTARLFGDDEPRLERRVALRPDPERLHLFAESGERIA